MEPPATDAPQWVISTIALILFGVISAAFIYLYLRIKEGVKRVASQMGLEYDDHGDNFVPLPSYFHLHESGPKHLESVVHQTVYGRVDDIEVYVFNFKRMQTGDGTHSDRRVHGAPQTVGIFIVPGLRLPKTLLRPEGLRHKVLESRYQDIDFPDAPAFSRKYLVESDNEAALREHFTPGVLEFFAKRPNRIFQGFANEIIYYKPVSIFRLSSFSARRVHATLSEGLELCRRLRQAASATSDTA